MSRSGTDKLMQCYFFSGLFWSQTTYFARHNSHFSWAKSSYLRNKREQFSKHPAVQGKLNERMTKPVISRGIWLQISEIMLPPLTQAVKQYSGSCGFFLSGGEIDDGVRYSLMQSGLFAKNAHKGPVSLNTACVVSHWLRVCPLWFWPGNPYSTLWSNCPTRPQDMV